MDDSIKKKLIVVGVLSLLIMMGVLYLLLGNPKKEVIEPAPSIEPTIEPTIAPTPEPTPTPVVIDIDSDASINKVVNKERLVLDTYVPELTEVEGGKQLRPEAAQAYNEMVEAAKAEGVNLVVISAYRSYKEQRSLWFTYEEKYGRKYANRMDATPGASEHQLGLALDLGSSDGKCKLYECFKNTATGKWLYDNAYKYGFILRYPEGKESITGVMYTPWHYRYIGKDEAKKVFDSGQTLEEFYGLK